jgi:heme A synthase
MALQTAEQHFRFTLNCFLLVVILILCNGEPVQQLPHRLNIAQLLLTAAAAAVAAVAAAVVIAAVGREGGHAEDGLKQAFRPSVPDP